MPLLQRGELLQRQRVDLAQRGEVALGTRGPALLDGAVVGHRLGRGLPAGLGRGDLLRRRRHRRGRPVLAEQGRQVDAVLLGGPGLQRLDAVALLGPGDLVAVHLVGQPVELRGRRADPGAHLEQLRLLGGAGDGEGVPLGGRAGERRRERGERPLGIGTHARRHRGAPLPGGPDVGRAFPGRTLLPGLAAQRLRAAVQGPGPLLGGTDGEPRLGLGLPGGGDLGAQPVAHLGGGLLLHRRGLGVGQPLLERHRARSAPAPGPARRARGRPGAARPPPRPSARPHPARPAPRRPRTGCGRPPAARPAPPRRRPTAAARPPGRGQRGRPARRPEPWQRRELGLGLVDPGPHLTRPVGAFGCPPTAQSAPTRSPPAVTARTRGWAATRRTAASRSGTIATRSRERASAGRQRPRARRRRPAPSGCPRAGRASPRAAPAAGRRSTSRPARPPSASLRWASAAAASATPETTTASAMPAQRGGHRHLVPGRTVQPVGDRSLDARQRRRPARRRHRRPG